MMVVALPYKLLLAMQEGWILGGSRRYEPARLIARTMTGPTIRDQAPVHSGALQLGKV